MSLLASHGSHWVPIFLVLFSHILEACGLNPAPHMTNASLESMYIHKPPFTIICRHKLQASCTVKATTFTKNAAIDRKFKKL